MEFDNNKVLTPFTENKKEWIGWRGFGCDSVATLKNYIKNYPDITIDLYCLSYINDEDDIAVCNYPYRFVNVDFRYFYPIEPPAEKPTYRPCKNLRELAKSANDGVLILSNTYDEKIRQYNIFNALRGKPLYCKDSKMIDVITAVCFTDMDVRSSTGFVSLENLFEHFEWADKKGDARIIGVLK